MAIKPKNFFPVKGLLQWYAKFKRDLPWRRTVDPYAILVSEIMLQQTQVKTVIPYYRNWMRSLPNIRALADAREQAVLKLWEGLGYYRRARNLQAAARMIVEKWSGKFPPTFEGLLSLPGVGRYTAGAVGSMAMGWRVPVVDGNVVRVLARYLGVTSPIHSPGAQSRFWKSMETWLPQIEPGQFNQAVMELGATVCLPKNPRCEVCPLRGPCVAERRGWQQRLPKTKKIQSVQRQEYAVLMKNSKQVWLIQRKAGQWHHNMWALPSVLQSSPRSDWVKNFNEEFQVELQKPKLVGSIRYQVTRHRVTLRVYAAKIPQKKSPRLKAWGFDQLDRLPIVTAHRKILKPLSL